MNDLLRKIYNNVLIYEDDVIKATKTVDDDINLLIEPYKDHLSSTELEELKNLLSSTALTAELTGFEIGVRFVIQMITSILSD